MNERMIMTPGKIYSRGLRSIAIRNKYQGQKNIRRIFDDVGEDEAERLSDARCLPILCRRVEKKVLEEGEWEKIHHDDSKVLTVTKLVKYMGFGYEAAWRVNQKRASNQKLDTILLHGKTTEALAIQVLQKAWASEYEEKIEGFPKNSILSSYITDALGQRSSRLLYGTPDLICTKRKLTEDAEEVIEHTVVEIKCPYKHLCFVDLVGEGEDPREALLSFYKEEAPHLSERSPGHIRKFLGNVLQVCIYAHLMAKNPQGILGREEFLADTCKLVYFYPDVIANVFFFICYEIDYNQWVFDDDSGDAGPCGFHIEDIIREYYQDFVDLKELKTKISYRSGSYPLFVWNEQNDCDHRVISEEDSSWYHDQIQDLFSRGIIQISTQVIGGENTKEIALSAMDRLLEKREEQKPLEPL